jgi:transposase-like protein
LQEGSRPAAAVFATTLPLLLAYPPAMQDRVLPLVATTLVQGRELVAATALLQARKDDHTLDLARAMLQEVKGDSAGAAASYDRLAQSRDQSIHAQAALRAVELRLASGAIDIRQAADRLESLLYSWRGDQRERALRERLAELKTRVGEWRSALTLLRETETLFPNDKAAIHAELGDMFAAMLRDDAGDSLAPLELVAVVEENADLLPGGPAGEALQAKLADRLVALDLPKRAGPVLEKLMQAAKSDVARAGFGTRLAALRLRESDPVGAMAALDASVAADLPAELTERRTLLFAEASARRGDNEHALAALGSLNSPAADEVRATILERANNWPAAQKALADYAAKTVPPDGKLDDAQRRTLLRLATATARAGDNAALAALRQREGTRMQSGPLADMFRLLTADQVHSVADLKRSGQEAALARALPGELKALQPPAAQNP